MLDLRAGEGSADMERLWQLVQRADVVIESAEPGAPDHPDLTYARARRHNPRLVYCTITAYGGVPRHAGRPSQDSLVAARTGLQWEKRGWPGGSIERVNGVAPVPARLPGDTRGDGGPAAPGTAVLVGAVAERQRIPFGQHGDRCRPPRQGANGSGVLRHHLTACRGRW